MRSAVVALAALAVVLVGGARAATSQWESHAPLPPPRTEVVAATLGSEIAVLGGFTAGGGASTRADAYSPALDRWRRLPDLPLGVHHAMAAAAGGRLYVLGGYNARGEPLRTVFVLERRRWRSLPRLPFARAAAGAAGAGPRVVGPRASTQTRPISGRGDPAGGAGRPPSRSPTPVAGRPPRR